MNKTNRTEFDRITDEIFEKYGKICTWSDEQREKMCYIAHKLLQENEKYNLTAIKTLDGVIAKHLFDSVAVEAYIPENATVIDVGTGAGFPSLPLAVIRNDIRIVALDATEKKIGFVNTTAAELGLSNVSGLYGRAEELSTQPPLREKYDCAIARSVAGLPVLSELCLPFVKVGGSLLAMKADRAMHEIEESQRALTLLGASTPEVIHLYNDENGEARLLFTSKKQSSTPANYPRRFAQIKKKPL